MLNQPKTYPDYYLAGSRFLTHALFWLAYYILFSLIWAEPDRGYFASFYLEFVLMPVRIFAVYCMIYYLIPHFLARRQYLKFFTYYVVMIVAAGLLQMMFGFLFYGNLMALPQGEFDLSLQAWMRSVILINSTVILLGAAKILQMYMQLLDSLESQPDETFPDFIEVKSDRRMYRIKLTDILYIEGMGNYVNYHLRDGSKRTVYGSIKETLAGLPKQFVRLHRSYIANLVHLDSYNTDSVEIGGRTLPRGKDVTEEMLQINSL